MKKNEQIALLRFIKQNPETTQRQMSKGLGYSLGKLNYLLKDLEKTKKIKIKNFNLNSNKKSRFKYFITSKGNEIENLSLDYSYLKNNFENNEDNFKRKKPFLIAEAGINHNGSLNDAKKLILLAKKYNFDAVKFQKRDIDVCIPEHQKKIQRETPWGLMSYYKYKKKIELNPSQYKTLNEFAKKNRIELFVSCWDTNSLKKMKPLKFKYNKIASAMITNLKFLNEVAKEKKETFISTGMCNFADIQKAVEIFNLHKCPFVLMHSVSIYPCNENLLNLNFIKTLKKKFKCRVGYSGHESSVSPTVTAYLLGADYIERHITLDRASWGTDQAASLEEAGMNNLTSLLKKIPVMLGDGKKKFLKEEKKASIKMRYWN